MIITAPRVALIPEEIKLIKDYIEQGGNLLLLSDPDVSFLNDLFAQLGIEQLAGEIINHHSTLDDPSFIVASQYPPHPITKDLLTTTLYPVVAVLKLKPNSAFKAQALLSSSDKSSLSSNNSPVYQSFVFAYALTRNISTNKQQRIVVVGDGDFLANAYIGNVGNLDMGLRMITWLIHEDRFIDIPAKIANDKSLQLNKKQVAIIGIGFLLVMPLVLISSGVIIWRSRRRK